MHKTIIVPSTELFDELTNSFYTTKQTKLILEHSLRSIYEWESKWHVPFFVDQKKTNEQLLDYVRCMTINTVSDTRVYAAISIDMLNDIVIYMNDPMTATWFSDVDKKRSTKIMTSERIYSAMISLGIPFECQNWHINKLLTLIKVCSLENQPKKKMSKTEWAKQRHALNKARRAKH